MVRIQKPVPREGEACKSPAAQGGCWWRQLQSAFRSTTRWSPFRRLAKRPGARPRRVPRSDPLPRRMCDYGHRVADGGLCVSKYDAYSEADWYCPAGSAHVGLVDVLLVGRSVVTRIDMRGRSWARLRARFLSKLAPTRGWQRSRGVRSSSSTSPHPNVTAEGVRALRMKTRIKQLASDLP